MAGGQVGTNEGRERKERGKRGERRRWRQVDCLRYTCCDYDTCWGATEAIYLEHGPSAPDAKYSPDSRCPPTI